MRAVLVVEDNQKTDAERSSTRAVGSGVGLEGYFFDQSVGW